MDVRRDLLLGKLCPPDICRTPVIRPRLERLLDEGVARGVVVISGPAGTGKTHLVAEWSAHRQSTPRDVAWLTLDGADRDPARFLRYVLAAIGSTDAGREALADLDPVPPSLQSDETYRARIQHALAGVAGDVLLVLDDFDRVSGSPTEHLLRRILAYPPGRVRLVLMTRIVPNLGQPRSRLAGHLTEIGVEDLALLVDETRQMLAVAGVNVGEDDLQWVQRLTGGWPACVRIVASVLATAPDSPTAMNDLPRARALLDAYLYGEIVQRQPPPLPAFMQATSIMDRLSDDLARVLTGRSDADVLLAKLAAANILRAEANPDGQWYTWQPVLAAALRRRVHDGGVVARQALHRRAAHWCRTHDLVADAVRHALAGRDADTATAVLADGWLNLVLSGESDVLSDLLSLFPEQVIAAHAELSVAAAFMSARADDVEVGLRFGRQAVRRAPDVPAMHRLGVEVMAALVRLYTATMTGQPCDGDAYRTALGLLERLSDPDLMLPREDRVRRALLRYNVGAFETSRRDFQEAKRHLRHTLNEATVLDLPYLQLSCRAKLVECAADAGQLRLGQEQGGRVLAAAQSRGWHSDHGLTAAHAGLAEIALLRDDIDAALHHVEEGRRILRSVDRLNRIRLTFLAAAALCAAGEVRQAAAEVELLGDQVGRAVGLPSWVPVLLAIAEAGVSSCQGCPEEGLERLESVSALDNEATAIWPYSVLHGDLLVRCGRPQEARDILAPWAERGTRRPADVGALVVDALAAEALGLHSAALSVLDRALEAAGDEHLIQPFVVSGSEVKALLNAVIERGTVHEPFAAEILTHMTTPQAGIGRTSAYSPFYVEPLSPREVEVLQLLQGTRRNTEIAAALHISVNTLRTHMKSIDRKLGVTDRRAAVRRARELRIL